MRNNDERFYINCLVALVGTVVLLLAVLVGGFITADVSADRHHETRRAYIDACTDKADNVDACLTRVKP